MISQDVKSLIENLAAVVRARNGNKHTETNALLEQVDKLLSAPASESVLSVFRDAYVAKFGPMPDDYFSTDFHIDILRLIESATPHQSFGVSIEDQVKAADLHIATDASGWPLPLVLTVSATQLHHAGMLDQVQLLQTMSNAYRGFQAKLKLLSEQVASQDSPVDYEAIEREHLGDSTKGTGIYHPSNQSKGHAA